MIVTIDEVKEWVHEDSTETTTLTTLIGAAEKYILNGTGNIFDSTNELAKIACLILIKDMYDNGTLFPGAEAIANIKPLMQQLTYCYGSDTV